MEQLDFIICSQCGAENHSSTHVCRMCSSPMSGDEVVRHVMAKTPDLLSTITFSATQGEPVCCPSCQEVNEPTYKFCCNCGMNLRQPMVGVHTVVDKKEADEQNAPSSPSSSENLASNLGQLKVMSATANCPKCGQSVISESSFCHKCGSALSSAPTVAIASVRPKPKPRLLLIIEGEQTGDEYEVRDKTVIGRMKGDITFPHDDHVSGRHARIEKRDNKFVLIDEGSRNGSFIRIKNEVEIEPGDMILIGKQFLRFEI